MRCPRTPQVNLLTCSPQPSPNAERKAGKLRIPFFKVFWYNLTREINPRSTDCKAVTLTATPLRQCSYFTQLDSYTFSFIVFNKFLYFYDFCTYFINADSLSVFLSVITFLK